jgi:hypothetical protein
LGLEGIVSKRRDSRYRSGRSLTWLKIKNPASDRSGNLYIFEIKVWESHHENLLQALRYGQLNGALDYDGLNEIWMRRPDADRTLNEAHQGKFDLQLKVEEFNSDKSSSS